MPLTMAINAWYRHPGREQARIRAFVTDQMELIETHAGQELSVGPVEFGTDFGGWRSHAKPHGGWNVDGHNIWLATAPITEVRRRQCGSISSNLLAASNSEEHAHGRKGSTSSSSFRV